MSSSPNNNVPFVCGCIGYMMPEQCPDCAGQPSRVINCTTCGTNGLVFRPCTRCTGISGSVGSASGGAPASTPPGPGRPEGRRGAIGR